MKIFIKIIAIIIVITSMYFVTRLESYYVDDRIVVAIDIGHAVDQPGAIGIVTEFDINEVTGHKLYDLLEEDGRFKPIITNENRLVDMPLADRRDVAEDAGAELLISIHANSSPYGDSVKGFEIYPQVPEHVNHEESYEFATLVKNGYLTSGYTPRDFTGIFYLRFESDSDGNTIRYALNEDEEEQYDFTGESFGIIKSEVYPAILLEQGYVTSQTDVDNVLGDSGTTDTAQILYEAICDYFKEELNESN